MAKIVNIEKSKYLNENIKIYESNKVGQYSKFLDKNPIFVTWLHINSAETRSDIGTGGVNADVGINSPIRFNQINNLPTYNIPDLKPDIDYSENGYDIELDISDAVLLPNTIVPSVGDYLIITLPTTTEIALRVNTFNYNTIQSNDFYTYSADLKYTGKNLIDKFKNQIVQEYETIFENIGTDDKCFILTKDVNVIQSIGKLFLTLRDLYYNNFFDKDTGTFVCKNNDICHDGSWFYDKYVEKFIMNTKIYYTENEATSIVLSCADLESSEAQQIYTQSLFYAVENRNKDYLASYPYFYQVDIQRRLSPFILYNINCKGVNLVLIRNKLVKGHSDAIDSGMCFEYFSHLLIDQIKNEFIEKEVEHQDEEDNDSEFEQDDTPKLNYLEKLILQYMLNQMDDIDKNEINKFALRVDSYTYRIMPIILYIILQYYESYFKKEEL